MKRRERAGHQEERWLVGLKKALLKHGVTVDAIAGVIKRAMEAERLGVGEDGEVVSLGDHHVVQLKGASLAIELYRPPSARQLDERPILNIQAGAKVQLVFFGEAIDAIPEAPSPELQAALVRSGRLLPDGGVPKPVEAKTEAPKVLPEGKARERGEGWLR